MPGAVTAPGDEEANAVDLGDEGRRRYRFVKPFRGRIDPNAVACAFVESKEAMGACSEFAPAERNAADDDERTIDHRRGDAPRIRQNESEFLMQVPGPQRHAGPRISS